MARKILLVVLAVIVSFALTALGGYFLYGFSAQANERQLPWLTNHFLNPCSAVVIGLFVGSLSRNHAIPTAIVGLALWALSLNIYCCRPTAEAISALCELEVLAAIAAALSWRLFHKKGPILSTSLSLDNNG